MTPYVFEFGYQQLHLEAPPSSSSSPKSALTIGAMAANPTMRTNIENHTFMFLISVSYSFQGSFFIGKTPAAQRFKFEISESRKRLVERFSIYLDPAIEQHTGVTVYIAVFTWSVRVEALTSMPTEVGLNNWCDGC